MSVAEREPYARVYGDFLEDPVIEKPLRRPFFAWLSALLLLALIFLGYEYASLESRYEDVVAMQALRSYRSFHRISGTYPPKADGYDVPGERDLEDFCRNHQAVFFADRTQNTIVIIMNYSGLFGQRTLVLGTQKPDGRKKDGSPIYLPHRGSMREL